MHRHRQTLWIIGTVVLCAGLGAWLGHHIGDGRAGYVALIGATCGVLGSFFPGAVSRLRARLREHGKPHQGAA